MNGCSLRLLAEVGSHARTSCANPLALGDWNRARVRGVELDTVDIEHDPLLLEDPSAANRLFDDAVVEYFSGGDVLRPAPFWREPHDLAVTETVCGHDAGPPGLASVVSHFETHGPCLLFLNALRTRVRSHMSQACWTCCQRTPGRRVMPEGRSASRGCHRA